jgi:hypothetical protein
MTDEKILYPDGKELTIAGKKFTIKPFVLSKRIKVLKIVSDAIREALIDRPGLDVNQITTGVKFIEIASGPKLVEFYEIILDEKAEWLNNNVMMKDEVNIIEAVVEVNDIPFLFRQVKNLLSKSKKTN